MQPHDIVKKHFVKLKRDLSSKQNELNPNRITLNRQLFMATEILQKKSKERPLSSLSVGNNVEFSQHRND